MVSRGRCFAQSRASLRLIGMRISEHKFIGWMDILSDGQMTFAKTVEPLSRFFPSTVTSGKMADAKCKIAFAGTCFQAFESHTLNIRGGKSLSDRVRMEG